MLHDYTCNMRADVCRYVFTRVPSSSTGSPQQGSTSKKRDRDEAAPTSPANKRHQSSPVQPAPAVDAGALQKLRKSNDVRLYHMRVPASLCASVTAASDWCTALSSCFHLQAQRIIWDTCLSSVKV